MPGPDGLGYTNTATYTAANGDLLRTTNIGTAIPTEDGTGFLLSGVETTVGGTGRFARAAGSATIVADRVSWWRSMRLARGQGAIVPRGEHEV